MNDSLGWLSEPECDRAAARLSEPSVTERRRAARIKSSHSDQGKTKAFAFVFCLSAVNVGVSPQTMQKKRVRKKFFKKVLTNGILCDSITSSLYHAKAIKQ